MLQGVRTVVVSACVSALVAGAVIGTHAAFGSDGPVAPPEPVASVGAQPPVSANQTRISASFQEAGRTSEMSYVPIAPCTLVDTAKAGGAFANGAVRNYDARGDGSLAAQGGNANGCKIPGNAAVLALAVRAVESITAGSIRVGPGSGSIAVNYRANQITTGFTNVDLASPTQPKDFKVQNAGGPTHLVLGAVGYFIAPMGAVVYADASVLAGSRLINTIKFGAGDYEIDFDRNITKCFYSVTPYTAGVVFNAAPRIGSPNGVFVEGRTPAGVLVDSPFFLTVTC